jgi:hypothetical protein
MSLTRRSVKDKLTVCLVRILSLDGGGVRGCTELRILQRIERLAGLDDSRDPAIPWDNFCQITRRNTGG